MSKAELPEQPATRDTVDDAPPAPRIEHAAGGAPMPGQHNHPPRCCCAWPPEARPDNPRGRCPACALHGDLAACPRCGNLECEWLP